jgi:hypothetical protein
MRRKCHNYRTDPFTINMKLQHSLLIICLINVAGIVFGQTNQTERLLIPFLDKETQSNVIVTVCDFSKGQPCPTEYANVISNTNLFTSEEQKTISEVFVKYRNVTTNSGPPGTVLASLYKTNNVVKAMGRIFTNEFWTANFQYTNFEAREEIRFGGGFSAKFRNKANNGYNVVFTRTGGGTLLTFGEVKQDLTSGLFVRFEDNYPQGITWDYKLARFNDSHLEEYRHYTNKMVVGNFLMWNSQNGNLMLKADFKEPYDFEKYRTDLKY